MPPAIAITLYSENDEKKAEYRRLIVPWGFLKRAVNLSKELGDGTNISEEQIDMISDLLVEYFGAVFTRVDLEKGADISEIMSCFQAILARANSVLPNLPPPAS